MRTQTKLLGLCAMTLISTVIANAQVTSVSGSGTGISVTTTTGAAVVTNTAPLTASALQSTLAASPFNITGQNGPCTDQDVAGFGALIWFSGTNGTPSCAADPSRQGLYTDGLGMLLSIDNSIPFIAWQLNPDGTATFSNVVTGQLGFNASGSKIVGVGNGTTSTDAAAFGQLPSTISAVTGQYLTSYNASTHTFTQAAVSASGVTSITAGTGLSASGSTGSVTLTNTAPLTASALQSVLAASPFNITGGDHEDCYAADGNGYRGLVFYSGTTGVPTCNGFLTTDGNGSLAIYDSNANPTFQLFSGNTGSGTQGATFSINDQNSSRFMYVDTGTRTLTLLDPAGDAEVKASGNASGGSLSISDSSDTEIFKAAATVHGGVVQVNNVGGQTTLQMNGSSGGLILYDNFGTPNITLNGSDGTLALPILGASTSPLCTTASGVLTNSGCILASAAESLTGTSLNSSVTSSSLTSIGTLTSLTVSGNGTFGGNVGIGTTTPDQALVVNGNVKFILDPAVFPDRNVASIVALGYSGITGARNWALRGVFQNPSGVGNDTVGGDFDLIKALDGNTILATETHGNPLGNVGIGTANPHAPLDIAGTQIHIYDPTQDPGNYSYVKTKAQTNNTQMLTLGTTYGYQAPIDALSIYAGRVGIYTGGAIPAERLEVGGNVQVDGHIVFSDGSTLSSAASSTTFAAPAANLTGSTLNSTVTSSSLTSVGILTSLAVSGNGAFGAAPSLAATIAGHPGAPATSGNTQTNGSLRITTNTVNSQVLDSGLYDSGMYGAWLQASNGGDLTANSPLALNPNGGNVGIGTAAPTQALEVNGSIKLDGLSPTSSTIMFSDGTTQSTAWNGVLSGGDYAESVDVVGDRGQYEPGDIMVIDSEHPDKFMKSSESYSTMVAGIYSTKPGLTGRHQEIKNANWRQEEVPMAMMGIVPTKVSAENGAIKPGDLLVSSSTPGYAMKGTESSRMLGSVIGKAMGHLDSGKGVIQVLVSLQ